MSHTSFELPRHPLGVRPSGNAYTTGGNAVQRPFDGLSDELVMQMFDWLDDKSLVRLGATCKALYALTRCDDVWRARCTENGASGLTWRGSWYASHAGIQDPAVVLDLADGFASDALYRPFLCAHTPLQPFVTGIPDENKISRLPNLSQAEFDASWVNRPFILTEPVKEWPVFQSWDENALIEKYHDVVFRAESVDWPLASYAKYMHNNSDESPLYLFDRAFVEKMKLEVGHGGDYWAPDCFGQDLFLALGDQRPDSRWLITGPERSGSTFHKDPNGTSAWNAVIRGSKYWIMFPSGPKFPEPPGVYVSADQSEVTSPLSIAEWLMSFHEEARVTPGCVEGICEEGEVLHVPSGWWHLVVNLKPGIAITQNFVPEAHLAEVYAFLRDKPDQVSGFAKSVSDPYALFKTRLEQQQPELLQKALAKLGKKETGKRSRWEELVNGHADKKQKTNGETNGFSFGFNDDDDADVP